MIDSFSSFESLARSKINSTHERFFADVEIHPFDSRNIHSLFPPKVRILFDNGHYSEATLLAFKYLEKLVKQLANSNSHGKHLMMEAFSEQNPLIKITPLVTTTDTDIQEGFKFLFAGSMLGIRNPLGHEVDLEENPDKCLDELSFASLLIRRLEESRIDLHS